MGTDIHLYTEIRVDGRWQPLRDKIDGEYRREFDDRNYDLFAILADVRNGRGFAGVETGSGFEVKYPPRGLPADLSDDFKSADDDYLFGDHTFSWLTFTEVLSLPFHKISKKTGWLRWEEYAKWIFERNWRREAVNNGPEEWCGGVSGSSVTHVPESVFKERYEALTTEDRRALWQAKSDFPVGGEYTQVEWSVTYAFAARYFFSDYFLPTLAEAAERGCGPDDIRMVFGFDS